MKQRNIVLCGLEGYKDAIKKIIKDLRVTGNEYDIRLILTEAITNAYIHGNNRDPTKEIYLRYSYDGETMKFEIEDCGKYKNISIPKEIPIENLLDDKGRGLYLINCCANYVEFHNGTLLVEKVLKN